MSRAEVNQYADHIKYVSRGKDIPTLLYDLLKHATPYKHEKVIIDLLPFKDRGRVDMFGNFIIKIGPDNPKTMFSCHMDTVHSEYGIIFPVTMGVKGLDSKKGMIWAVSREFDKVKGEYGKKIWPCVLGADDKIGIYTLCKLIEHEVPGLYVFHVGEECGAIGSKAIASKTPELVKGIERCIAFDRRGYTDVIAHQRGGRCASTEFTNALADQLNTHIMLPKSKYRGDVHGVFTDTASYTALISECTNISIGYDHEHGPDEQLDWYWYSTHFQPAVLKIDWDALPTTREAKDETWSFSKGSYYGSNWSNNNYSVVDSAKAAYEDVNKNTPYYKIPDWKPEDGFIYKCTSDGMNEIILKWVRCNNQKAAALIADLLVMNDIQTKEYEALKKEYEDFMGVEEDEDGIDAEAVEVTSEPRLPDDGSIPFDPDTFKEMVDYKFELIDGLFNYVIPVGMDLPNKCQSQLQNALRRFSNIRQRKECNPILSTEDYTSLNAIIIDVGTIYATYKTKCPETLTAVLRDCWEHINERKNEPKFKELVAGEAA